MKIRRWGAVLLALALALSLTALPAAAEGETRQQAADAAIQVAATYGGTQSIQFALWEEGEITLTGKAGDYSRTENRLLLEDDLYGIGSVSKVYTTAAVMLLAERGKIDLDAPVTRYLPDFKMADERYADITVRMLLNHSSGLMGSTLSNTFLFDDPDETQGKYGLLDALENQTLKADPGAYSTYCNDGFTLAELVVEAVSGRGFGDFLHENILGPAGLEDTFVPGDDFDTARLAKTYLGEDTRALPAETVAAIGTGGIYASASDLAAFGGLLTGEELLSQQSLDAMALPEYRSGMWPDEEENAVAFGLGWDSVRVYPFAYSDVQALTKGGDTTLYHSSLIIVPEYDMACAVVSSGGSSAYNQMAAARILVDALAGQGVAIDESARSLPESQPADMPAELMDFAGLYISNLLGQATVALTEEGVMTLSIPLQGAELVLHYYEDGSFRDATGSYYFRFVTEENGEVYLLQRGYTDIPGLGGQATAEYVLQKADAAAPDAATDAAWQARSGKVYLVLNEKYTSQTYLILPMSSLPYSGGYILGIRAVDENNAVSQAQIPSSSGRDGNIVRMYTEGGLEYMDALGSIAVEGAAMETLYNGATARCTIQPTGYARWYAVGAAAGRTLSVDLPESGGFFVYDQNGVLTASSWIYGDSQAVLPEGGYVLFAGDAGQVFHMQLQ